MAHRQAPALPQSGKGENYMKISELDCGLTVMGLATAKPRILRKIIAVGCLAISITLNFQVRTGEELA